MLGRFNANDRGTVLLLFPTSVIVVLVLAAIVLDFGLVHVRTQELRAVAASAANDVLGAIDIHMLRSTGNITFDLDVAHGLVETAIATGPLPAASVESVSVVLDAKNRWKITVTARMPIDYMIAPALPGRKRSLQVAVSESVFVVS